MTNNPVYINGDGETSRDFCYIDNAVQANILAATVNDSDATGQVYNIAVGDRTTLNELFELIRSGLSKKYPRLDNYKATHRDFRVGDVRHSLADILKAERLLGYEPTHRIAEGMGLALGWYVKDISK